MVDTSMVKIELSRPTYKLQPEDVARLAVSTEVAYARITAQLIQGAVQAKYPNGMDSRDSRRWGPILERLLDGTDLDLSRGDFDWLYRLFMDDDLKLLPGVAHWRLSLEAYFIDLKDALKRAPSKEAAE